MENRRHVVRIALAVIAVAGIAAAVHFQTRPTKAEGPSPKAAAGRAVPVLVAEAVRRDVPVWLEGLGTVTAWRQVTIRTQVEGILRRVHFEEGQEIRKGQVLAQVDPRPFEVQLRQAEGAKARDQAILKGAEANLARYRELDRKQLVPKQQVDDQLALVGQTMGALRVDESQIASAKLNLSFARIRAPMAGVTGIRLVDPGNLVRPTDPTGLVVLAQLDPAAVLLTLPQDDLPAISAAQQKGEVVVEAFSRDGRTRLGTGTLVVVDNQINLTTATLRIKARIPNPERGLWPNQFVKARLLVDTRKDALVIPAAAVQRGPQGTFVYVVEPGDVAGVRTIEIALTTAESIVVKSGLQAGDKVVVEGQNQLRPKAKVTARNAALTASAPPKPGAKNLLPGKKAKSGKGATKALPTRRDDGATPSMPGAAPASPPSEGTPPPKKAAP